MPRIVSIGAATQDIFLSGKIFIPVSDGREVYEQLPLGSKLEVEQIDFSTGGGATNASATFARQGLDAVFMGVIGHDPAGEAVIKDLDREHIDTSHVVFTDEFKTGYSCIILSPNGERTVLTYRGASSHFKKDLFDIGKVTADWIYISSLAGHMETLEAIVSHAAENNIKVALNPGKDELAQPAKLRALLDDVEVLQCNTEEMAQLVEGTTAAELAQHAAHYVPYAIVTDGPKGVAAVGDKKLVVGGMYEDAPVIDRLGAGDAFCSGVIAILAQGKTLEEAIVFASANSTSVVGHIGAKTGILKHGVRLHDMPLKVTPFR